MSTSTPVNYRNVRNLWANHVVREKLAAECNLLRREGKIEFPLHDLEYTRDRLPHLTHEYKSPDAKSEPPPRKVCIVGAGIAGLFIAMILQDLQIPNLTYEIFEAGSRIGGRVYTHQFTEEKHDYYDIGAMRYPDIPIMKRTFELFRRTNMPMIPYVMDGGDTCPKLFNNNFFDPEDPDPYRVSKKNGGDVPDDIVSQKQVEQALEDAFGPYKKELANNFDEGFEKLMAVDDYSTREFLKRGGPDGTQRRHDYFAIQWMETLNTSSNLFDQAFSESVMDSFDFDNPDGHVKWFCIEGGTSLLTEAMTPMGIETIVNMNKRVEAISWNPELHEEGNMSIKCADEPTPRGGYSTVFNTTSLGCLQRMDLRTLQLHPSLRDAIRSVHYDHSVKVALKFKYPWWIKDCGIKGGVATTDLPLRTCVYPSYNLHDGLDKPAVLLASYTWAQDAARLGSLVNQTPNEDELVELVLRNLVRLHAKSNIAYEKIKGALLDHHAYAWTHDPNTAGAFALFGPGQFKNLYPYLRRPAADSKFHVVGEASSAHHAWIVGALDSALSSVYCFLQRFYLDEYKKKLENIWGKVDELGEGKSATTGLQVALGTLREGQHVVPKPGVY
ncbi:hypothetical protein F4819DRAFT_441224 [Hypoxylon fuscum]|nr:hypothetical protein F4819DRAFT_441224 [Hypoxylon fuscum]